MHVKTGKEKKNKPLFQQGSESHTL